MPPSTFTRGLPLATAVNLEQCILALRLECLQPLSQAQYYFLLHNNALPLPNQGFIQEFHPGGGKLMDHVAVKPRRG